MHTHHHTIRARRLAPVAAVLTVAALGLAGPSEAAGCTVLDQPPGQTIARVAPFNGQISPGNPYGLDEPVVASICRPDTP